MSLLINKIVSKRAGRVAVSLISGFFAILFFVSCANSKDSEAIPEIGESDLETEQTLDMSDMIIKISSAGKVVKFRLYDTEAAEDLYRQLPLELDVTNFRDAQWMFYPPEKLRVTDEEAYHDGKKGELSYYEPWGDVFMLYKDFYAGDLMHRLGVCIEGIDKLAGMSGILEIKQAD